MIYITYPDIQNSQICEDKKYISGCLVGWEEWVLTDNGYKFIWGMMKIF